MRQTPTPTPTKNKISDYTEVSTIGRGAFGSVVEARYVRTGDRVALKRVSMRDEKRIAVTLIREITTMRQCIDHPNIVKFIDAFADGKSLVLVMEKMECDLNVLLRSLKEPLPPNLSKAYLRMILLATNYLHSKDLIHRDIKPSNIMISSNGVLKLGDFGLARVLSHSSRRLTPQVSTRWYRSPEVLFGSKTYGFGTDMWSVGCVFAELLTLEPLFSGDNDIDQISRIFQCLGTPNEKIWPDFVKLPDANKIEFSSVEIPSFSSTTTTTTNWTHFRFPDTTSFARSLLCKFICLDPKQRLDARSALLDRYFFVDPLPTRESNLPRFVGCVTPTLPSVVE
jgi:serine/threonine protein kinase